MFSICKSRDGTHSLTCLTTDVVPGTTLRCQLLLQPLAPSADLPEKAAVAVARLLRNRGGMSIVLVALQRRRTYS
ncbi:hypothetical protein CF640_36610 [Burkholderia pseudomallei]|nr:hypothetical protein CF640_36610 [Burkholderia pseudomallei]